MSKHDSLREWRLIKARTLHQCDSCEKIIEAKEQYWAEYLSGRVRPQPRKTLLKLCRGCYSKRQSV